MTAVGIPRHRALRLQLAAITGNEPSSSYLELRFKTTQGMGQEWIPVFESDRAVRAIVNRSDVTDVYVGAAPRIARKGIADAVKRVWALWADCDSVESVESLWNFRPLPSIVIRSGTDNHLHAWWQLSGAVTPEQAVRANRRLALTLGADRAATDAARIMRPAGSLNHKTSPPRPVECVRLEPDAFEVAGIVRGLADDPAYVHTSRPRCASAHADGQAVLAGLAQVVREATVGARNNALNWAAYRAGEHAAEGAFDAAEAESELLAAAVDAGLGEPEAQRTIASGFTAATGRRTA